MSASAEAGLSGLNLKLSYRTGRDNLVRDFYNPCLERASLYRRAAGYFTSHGLALAACGVANLVARGGKMRLVVSPHLDAEDALALRNAADNPSEVLRRICARNLADIEDILIKDRLNALAWLGASGKLEIKLALRVDGDGVYANGIYHEKIGIFSDDHGNQVSFSGSSNETAGGLVENFESIKVFCSWRDQEGRVQEEIDNFEALWNDATPGLSIVDFSSVSAELLERYRDPNSRPSTVPGSVNEKRRTNHFRAPDEFNVRPYQSDAIRAWAQAGGKGIFAMATGSGKTLTSIALALKVSERNRPLVILIACPFINLCRQWIRDLEKFGLSPVEAFEGKERWSSELDLGYQRLSIDKNGVMAIVCTNATFMGQAFQTQFVRRVAAGNVRHLFIADEVHNLGASGIRNVLPEQVELRLGLSATPERHMDPEGTRAVFEYFGNVVYEYPIDRAISEGRLCKYRYHPVLVELTEDETDEYIEISEKLARLLAMSDGDDEINQVASRLMIRRARLLGSAENKIVELDSLLSRLGRPPEKSIFYCGDGRTLEPASAEEMRQIEAVTLLLGEKHHLRVRSFTYQESSDERESIIQDLVSGSLDGIVAIRCLDEGIDIPDLRVGFILASSTNPRQFVQRRGRLLRQAKGKERADIYDFIIVPPDMGGGVDDATFNMERRLFERELKRIVEFCRVAENGHEALASLRDIRKKYNLISG